MNTIALLMLMASISGEPRAPLDDQRPRAPMDSVQVATADAVPTPYVEVLRVLALMPKPEVGFVDFGCGAEARWCIAAAERWGGKVTGVEINPYRAAAARQRVQDAGLAKFITIVEGDATKVDVEADVGVAYLFPDVLEKLRPKIVKLKSFASYIHQPAGLPAVKNGDSWIVTKQPATVSTTAAVWNGVQYSGPVCNNPNCGMCNSIRAQLAKPTVAKVAAGGHYETRKFKFCNGRACWFEDREVWVPD